jgi:hypothetical protein
MEKRNFIHWVDIARGLAALDPDDSAWKSRPADLDAIEAYWDTLEISVDENRTSRKEAIDWLRSALPGLDIQPDETIRFDAPLGLGTLQNPRIGIDTESPRRETNRPPSAQVETSTVFAEKGSGREAESSRSVPVVACHSMGSGAGATTMAVSLAKRWSEAGAPILLVDASMSSPSLSRMFADKTPEFAVSFEDALALHHASKDDDEKAEVAKWIAERLEGKKVDDVVVMPATRHLDQVQVSAIRPEHLSRAGNYGDAANFLADIANACGCAGVVVDLPSGYDPTSALFLGDPAIGRILCTTTAAQSLSATRALIGHLTRDFIKRGHPFPPTFLCGNKLSHENAKANMEALDALFSDMTASASRCTVSENDVFLTRDALYNAAVAVPNDRQANVFTSSPRMDAFIEKVTDASTAPPISKP